MLCLTVKVKINVKKSIKGKKMSHRKDLIDKGFMPVKYGSEKEIKALASLCKDDAVTKKVVQVNDKVFELYVKPNKK
jgi:hypothetical protein